MITAAHLTSIECELQVQCWLDIAITYVCTYKSVAHYICELKKLTKLDDIKNLLIKKGNRNCQIVNCGKRARTSQ